MWPGPVARHVEPPTREFPLPCPCPVLTVTPPRHYGAVTTRTRTTDPDTHRAPTPVADPFIIDCDQCTLQGTDACADCLVSFVLNREPEDAVVIDADEARAVRMLERAGLVPSLRFSQRAG